MEKQLYTCKAGMNSLNSYWSAWAWTKEDDSYHEDENDGKIPLDMDRIEVIEQGIEFPTSYLVKLKRLD